VWPSVWCRLLRPIFIAQIFLTCTLERWDFRSSPQSPPCISTSLQTFALQHSTSSSTNSRQCSVLGERKKGRLVVAFWWVFVWILFKCYSTRPWPAMFLHAPPPWITNPTPHAAPRCGREITGEKRIRTINYSRGEFCIFYSLKYSIRLYAAPDLPSSATPPLHNLQSPRPTPPTPAASI
jgi:hypothetical protein